MKILRRILTCVCVLCLSLASASCTGLGSMSYDNAENYSVGDTSFTQPIENIDVDWVSGKVKVVTHSEEVVSLTEKTDFSASDDMRVHWWLDETTLRIRFCASGMGMSIFGYGRKELTIKIPDSITLSDLTVKTSSADFGAENIKTKNFSVTTSSGGIDVSCRSETVDLDSVSGSVRLDQKGKALTAEVNTTSGAIKTNFEQCEKVNLGSVSGKIEVVADEIERITVDSTSGQIDCSLVAFKKCNLKAVSGSVNLFLPENAEFVAEVNSTSGDFTSDFALKKDGNVYTCGNGDARIDLSTTSGNVAVKEI